MAASLTGHMRVSLTKLLASLMSGPLTRREDEAFKRTKASQTSIFRLETPFYSQTVSVLQP